ncbi:DUF4184 family protein [Actinacidiphila oryziradicis]|uniref:DUF4184 family protein n=1 Tax=Actinacidiphila oryziradicis TaxID=2571141 RepID=UPI0023F216EA|nr:DUF4184 family protein [Actinacidiphila oryziradicis]MCW2874123.1 rane protein [Actinacidiphila oryziradicis]
MPFTLSHAAAVLPLLRRDGSARGPLITTALVAGSFAPDVPFFAESFLHGVYGYGEVTHSVPGILTSDPLIAAALAAGWWFVRDPLIAPPPSGRGCPVPVSWNPRNAAWFWASAALGAATHIGWDTFTHQGRWGVRTFPVLNTVVHGMPLHHWAQYGSSAAGLVLVAAFAARARHETPRRPDPRSARSRALMAALLGGSAAAGAAARCARWYQANGATESILDLLPTALFGGGAGLAGGALVYAGAARLRARLRRGEATGDSRVG